MNNQEFARVLLCEATELLNEAAARDQRKAVQAQLKGEAEKAHAFLKGHLSKEEADKVYKEVKEELSKIERKIEEIPPETVGEMLWAYLIRSTFTVKGYTRYLIVGLLCNAALSTIQSLASFAGLIKNLSDVLIFNSISNVTTTAAGIATFNSLRKTKSGAKNWNKAYAEDLFNRLQKKLDKAYAKYYSSAQNESSELSTLLTEAALLLND